jgi:PilZ domain
MTTEPTARVDAMSQVCAKSFEERRASPRQRRFNGAKIVFNNNSSVIDCIVRDLSAHGARLVVASPVGIPERFDLRIDRNGMCHPSKVTWRTNDQIGVSFSTFPG